MQIRFLGPRERERVGAAIIQQIRLKKRSKKVIKFVRTTFSQTPLNERSTSIVEGLLLAAQREHEEKKPPFYGNLLANIVFTPRISRAHGNLLIKIGQSLSYHQLCLLSLFAQKNKFKLRQGDYRGTTEISLDKLSLLQESFGLARLELINIPGDAILGLTDINPARMDLNGEGRILFQLMELSKIDFHELTNMAVLFE